MVENFQQRKKDILSKIDKSSIGSWDKKIIDLCEKINSLENYYTTSSCAGRIVLIKDEDEKRNDLFLKVWHDLIGVDELKEELENIKEETKFKQEPCILHVACESLEDGHSLLDKAKLGGWKRSGIISTKNIVVELISTEKLEFPIVKDGKLLVDDDFLEVIVEKSNDNLKKTWNKIEKLLESI